MNKNFKNAFKFIANILSYLPQYGNYDIREKDAAGTSHYGFTLSNGKKHIEMASQALNKLSVPSMI